MVGRDDGGREGMAAAHLVRVGLGSELAHLVRGFVPNRSREIF